MKLRLVDAFTDRPLHGGPAYVVAPFDEWPRDAWRQAMPSELAQPETVQSQPSGAPFPHGKCLANDPLRCPVNPGRGAPGGRHLNGHAQQVGRPVQKVLRTRPCVQ